jgi:hypothetical protein
VLVYVATYEDVDDAIARAVAAIPARVDTVIVIHETVIEPHYWVTPDTIEDFRVGLGIGFEGLYVSDFDFNVPTAQLTVELKRKLYISFAAGYRPKDASDDPEEIPGDRSESLIAIDLEYYPTGWWVGLAGGYLAAYENHRQTDEFLERAYGLTVGPRLRLFDYLLVLGVDFGYFDLSRFGAEKTEREFGVAPSIRLNYMF